MKSKFFFIDYKNNVKKITKKEAMALITERQFEEAKNYWRDNRLVDPYLNIEYMVRGGRLNIVFEE